MSRVAFLNPKNQIFLENLFGTILVGERIIEILDRYEERLMRSIFKSRYLQSSPENIKNAETILYDEISNYLAEQIVNPTNFWSKNIKRSLSKLPSGSPLIKDEPDWGETDFLEADRKIKDMIDKSMPEVDILGMIDEYLDQTKIPVYSSMPSKFMAPVLPTSKVARRALFRFSAIRFAAGLDEWTKDSKRSFWDSVGGTMKKCTDKVKSDLPDIDDPTAFCKKIKSDID